MYVYSITDNERYPEVCHGNMTKRSFGVHNLRHFTERRYFDHLLRPPRLRLVVQHVESTVDRFLHIFRSVVLAVG